MDSNQKKFNIYVFLSTFARNLVELFIPIILYKFGYSVKDVMFYFLMMNVFSTIMSYPSTMFINKFGGKVFSVVGIVFFAILQILLGNIWKGTSYLLLIAFCFAMYRRGYWMPRRYYNLKVMHRDNISSSYSIITIINQLGIVISSYIGSLVLDFLSIDYLTIVAIILFLLSLLPLRFLEFEHKETDSKIEVFKTIKSIPKRDLFTFGMYEIWYIVKFLFPIYLFLYVKDTYQTVGILTLITNLATMIFAYIYGKKINKNKNFLRLSIVLVCMVYLFKLNVTGALLVLASFLEGIFCKMYEISVQKEFYALSRKFEYHSYNCVYDLNQNIFRTIVTLIMILIGDLKMMIIFGIFCMLSGIVVEFKKIRKRDYVKE